MRAILSLILIGLTCAFGTPIQVQGLFAPQPYGQQQPHYQQHQYNHHQQPQQHQQQQQQQQQQHIRPVRNPQLPPVYGPPTRNYNQPQPSASAGYNYQQPQPQAQPQPQQADSSYQQQQQQQYPQQQAASSGFGSSAAPGGGGGGGSGNTVECQMRQSADNQFKFSCEGVNPQLVTLKSEQILWLQNPSGSAQTVDIEVPNYKIEDFIKAYFKEGTRGGNNKINILLQKPQQSWEAAAQTPTSGTFTPQVQLQYEPVSQPQVIHYPRNTPYSSQPLPPLNE